ncbi:DNA N-6-adenine-methyltransferase [uncultured Psychromonas sp.]|uniref:DNA N-6-adenine-methyltransferase n=1 Tax=uncultured Psychromonas sp. TaxID=173974 RepID=UPI002619E6C5|nr:DNA N-6-adenine-methyltransferase [uncultured Psychromonas sp.]
MKANVNNLGYIGSKPGSGDPGRDSDSWFTPKKYTKMVRDVLGRIDLDPFSSEFGNTYVEAEKYFTVEQDAFSTPWFEENIKGSVFMNPPYGRGIVNQAADFFVDNVKKGYITEGVVLVNNATETKWFHTLLQESSSICLPSGRIAFENNDGKNVSGNTRGQVFLYFGSERIKFAEVFKEIGVILDL